MVWHTSSSPENVADQVVGISTMASSQIHLGIDGLPAGPKLAESTTNQAFGEALHAGMQAWSVYLLDRS